MDAAAAAGGALGRARPTRVVVDAGRRYSLWVFNVGLACCAVEFLAGSLADDGRVARLGAVPLDGDPRTADVLVVSGTVTDRTAPLVRRLWESMPEPRWVLSFGACANSGGPYWDSYCVVQGVDTVVPVDVYVPGCPPRPEAFLQGLRQLEQRREDRPRRTSSEPAKERDAPAPAELHR